MDIEPNILREAGLKPMLLSACFFYHNDEPNGQGVEYHMMGWPDEVREQLAITFGTENVAKYCLRTIRELGGSQSEAIKLFIEQCDAMRRPMKLDTQDAVLFSLNISALVFMGALEQSEYNGNQFMWEGIPI